MNPLYNAAIKLYVKKQGIWFVCADMGGQPMYQVDMKGSLGLVVGGEGEGVSRLVRDGGKSRKDRAGG